MDKTCTTCKQTLDVSLFYRMSSSKDGLYGSCKKCQDKRTGRWRGAHQERMEETCKDWIDGNIHKIQTMYKALEDGGYVLQKECIKCHEVFDSSLFYKTKNTKDGFQNTCKSCARKKSAKRQKKNPEIQRAAAKKWRRTHPEKAKQVAQKSRSRQEYIEHRRKQRRELYHSTSRINLLWRIRAAVRRCLREGKAGESWEKVVGYSLKQLKRHLEKQFTEGMSWDAFLRGEIHIDHIIPVSAFTFSKPDDIQFKACWALKNLRPMWAIENIKKSDKLLEPFQQYLL